MARKDASDQSRGPTGLASHLPGAKALRHKQWEASIKDSIVLHKGERFHHAYRAQLPVRETREWLRVILAITSRRLIVLEGGHFQIEADIGAVAHAYCERDLVYFTVKGEEKNWKITVRSRRSTALQKQLVKRAEQRLGHRPEHPVALFLAAMVEVAAEAQTKDQREHG